MGNNAQDQNNEVEKSALEIVKDNYNIPKYQRGYRWDRSQVFDLIKDLKEYYDEYKKDNTLSFYCMQAIIVKKIDNIYSVIDGQQRLTTMYILISYLIRKDLIKNINLGTITYESRKETRYFLEKIKNPEEELVAYINEARDIKFIYYAFKEIEEKLESDYNAKNENGVFWLVELLKADKIKFIYQDYTNENINEFDVFSDLNTGKISLTDAELIRAKLLIDIPEESMKETVAKEWDEIEHRLQDNTFWFFLQNDVNDTGSRIDYLFKLMAYMIAKENGKKIGENSESSGHAIYRYLNEYRLQYDESGKAEVKKESSFHDNDIKTVFWKNIKNMYEILNKWYEDIEIYNYIGQITYSGNIDTIVDLLTEYNELPRYEFIEKLKGIINASFGDENLIWPTDISVTKDNLNEIVEKEARIFSNIWYSGRKESKDSENKNPEEKRDCVRNFLLWSNCEYLNIQLRNTKFELLKYKELNNQKAKSNMRAELALTSVIEQKNYRFQFENLKTNTPDIEHIDSYIDSDEGKSFYESWDDMNKWCKNILLLCTDEEFAEIKSTLIEKCKEWQIDEHKFDNLEKEQLKNKNWTLFKKDEFKQMKNSKNLYQEFIEYLLNMNSSFKSDITKADDISEKNGKDLVFLTTTIVDKRKVGNIVLLDQNINRGYGNYPFRIKRHDLIEKSLNGIYVYPCTKMVFLKEFDSESTDLLHWNKEDFKKYRTFLANMYYDCFFIDQKETDKKIKDEIKKHAQENKNISLGNIEKIYRTDKILEKQIEKGENNEKN